MISDELKKKARELALAEIKKTESPSRAGWEISVDKGQWLAGQFEVYKDIVLLGTILMDYKLGEALEQGRLVEHTQMSKDAAQILLDEDVNITDNEKANILLCVEQHHGVNQFSSKEAEICCNADCYRFISVAGVVGGIASGKAMDLDELVQLYKEKVEEKWSVLTLDICKKELEPQYKVIKDFFNQYRNGDI